MTYADALSNSVEAELEAFGEEITFRGIYAKGIPGTTKETKAMEAAGYFRNSTLTLQILPPAKLGLENTPPKVNETIGLREKNWRIHQVETLVSGHAYTLIIEEIN